MNYTIYLSLLVSIIGLLMFLLIASDRPATVGKIAFGTGLLVFLLTFAGKTLSLS